MDVIVIRVAGIIAACGTIGGVAVWVYKTVKSFGNGIKCLLRKDMMDTYYNSIQDKTLHEYEKKNFLLEYEAYKALGGNSFIDDVCKVVRDWSVAQ